MHPINLTAPLIGNEFVPTYRSQTKEHYYGINLHRVLNREYLGNSYYLAIRQKFQKCMRLCVRALGLRTVGKGGRAITLSYACKTDRVATLKSASFLHLQCRVLF